MNVSRDKVVRFHYELRDASGAELESTRDREPHTILYGCGNIISGLERAMEERAAGDRFEVSVRPEEAYGLRRDGWTQRVSKKHLRGPKRFAPGMQVSLDTRRGFRTVTVLKVGSKFVDIDLNHPLAGVTLHFDVEIVEVRDAEQEEIAHGHVHGPGGVGH